MKNDFNSLVLFRGKYFLLGRGKRNGIVFEFFRKLLRSQIQKTFPKHPRIKRNQDSLETFHSLILFGLIVHSNDIMSIIIHVYHYENKENSL